MLKQIREARERESGFTLIELLIVVVILGILAAIVIFAVGGFTSTSAQGACKTEIKSIQTADAAFYAQKGSYPTAFTDLVPNYLATTPPTDQAGGASNHYFVKVVWTASPPTVTGTYDNGASTWAGVC